MFIAIVVLVIAVIGLMAKISFMSLDLEFLTARVERYEKYSDTRHREYLDMLLAAGKFGEEVKTKLAVLEAVAGVAKSKPLTDNATVSAPRVRKAVKK